MKLLQALGCQFCERIFWQGFLLVRWFHDLHETAAFAKVVNAGEQLGKLYRQCFSFGRGKCKLEGIAVIDVFPVGSGGLPRPLAASLRLKRFLLITLVLERTPYLAKSFDD